MDLALASLECSSAVPGESCRRAYGFVGGRQSKFESWGWGQAPCVLSFDELTAYFADHFADNAEAIAVQLASVNF